MPEPQFIDHIEEPLLKLTILGPAEYTGTIMDLCQTRRGRMQKMEYLSSDRVELIYELPLAEVVLDFFDVLKSRTKGYASLDYEPAGTQTDISSRSTSFWRVSPSTPFRRSCTVRRPTTTGAR